MLEAIPKTLFDVRPVERITRLDCVPASNSEWIAWWYCGLCKPQMRSLQPKVLVEFRRLRDKDGTDASRSSTVMCRVPVSDLGAVRIGSVWKDQQCSQTIVLEKTEFEAEFTPGSWRLTSLLDETKADNPLPFPQEAYPLKYGSNDRNRLLEFSLRSGDRLIIPCLEFFARCYGRSSVLRRDLATYPWDGQGETCADRFYAPLEEPETPDEAWKVRPTGNLTKGDSVFLAHAKYDPYTTKIVRGIYAELESAFSNRPASPAFVNIRPWFQGPARLRVEGRRFKGGFLGLRILGCSDPAGVAVQWLRDGLKSEKTNGISSDLDGAWRGLGRHRLVKAPEIVSLIDEDPDRDVRSVKVEDSGFVVLGEARAVRTVRRQRPEVLSGQPSKGAEAESYAGGKPHGYGKGVGPYIQQMRATLESHGVLRDMWSAMRYLTRKYPKAISSVSWFTFQDGFQETSDASTNSLSRFLSTDRVQSEIRHWLYLDRRAGIVRGVLVARMHVQGKCVDFFEIQRRRRAKRNKKDEAPPKEENFKGLVCMLRSQDEHEAWTKTFLNRVRHEKGIVENFARECPGKADTFKHSKALSDEVPCEAAVLNALKKMGIYLD
ncbi:hypothetical protein [Labrys sp. ZIDIC5]|uniref:hypothetical protein n=1 Tax=Labrys sedimenti TaxID=3106036 RepID=UPI002ACA0B6A|nr:hypothetical protein [Labrys sp. ZIDIC5]MDZ5453894.1 hypothetical protein [Labrys sp. ZIDIC5]